MVQEFQVLTCYKCETFQVQIVKKANKWECKMCGIKQSVQVVFGKGTSKDCRLHVQKLNELRMVRDIVQSQSSTPLERKDLEITELTEPAEDDEHNTLCIPTTSENKWGKYLEEDIKENELIEENEFIPESPKNKKRKNEFENNTRKKKIMAFNEDTNKNQIQEKLFMNESKIGENHNVITKIRSQPPYDNSQDINEHKIAFKRETLDKNNKWCKYIDENDLDESRENIHDSNESEEIHQETSIKHDSNRIEKNNEHNKIIDNNKAVNTLFNDEECNLDEIFDIK